MNVAISPSADLPSLSQISKREGRQFYRVSGDGRWFASQVGALVLEQHQIGLVVSDSSGRWWDELARLVSGFIRRRGDLLAQLTAQELNQLPSLAASADGPLVICYLGDSLTEEILRPILAQLLQGRSANAMFVGSPEGELATLLEAGARKVDGKIFTVRFQAPEISPEGHGHLRRVRAAVMEGLQSGYATQMYDAVLTAATAMYQTTAEGHPRSQVGSALAKIDLEGGSGRIRFDARGDRRDQGQYRVAEWRLGQFRTVRPDVIDTFDHLRLHPAIRRAAQQLVYDGHYSQAISEALKVVEQEVGKVSGITDKYGARLMGIAFNEDDPVIRLTEMATVSDRDEQEGYKLMFMGITRGIRNPYQHEPNMETDPTEALEFLALASLLMRRLDRRIYPS
jgi:uncharacterized protein (TIGR02391 family)